MRTKNKTKYQVGEIVYATYAFSVDKFIVKYVDENGTALMVRGGLWSGITILSDDEHRDFFRTGVIKKWYQFWK